MTVSFTALILAGGIRRSELSAQLGRPVLCLPVTRTQTVLDAWLAALANIGDCQSIRIVVSEQDDATQIRHSLEDVAESRPGIEHVQVIVEPARWRGTGGTIQDVVADVSERELFLMVEGSCLPPPWLERLFEPLGADGICSIGIGDESEPAGVYAFKGEVLTLFPSVGYFDVKEQLLPMLYEGGRGARAVKVADHVTRLRERMGYLDAVSRMSGQQMVNDARDEARRRVSTSAVVSATSLVESDVVIEDDAIVHDSVVMTGAVIRAGAVVKRSVVGSNVEITARRIVNETVESGPAGPRR